jgi:hypothetical protein
VSQTKAHITIATNANTNTSTISVSQGGKVNQDPRLHAWTLSDSTLRDQKDGAAPMGVIPFELSDVVSDGTFLYQSDNGIRGRAFLVSRETWDCFSALTGNERQLVKAQLLAAAQVVEESPGMGAARVTVPALYGFGRAMNPSEIYESVMMDLMDVVRGDDAVVRLSETAVEIGELRRMVGKIEEVYALMKEVVAAGDLTPDQEARVRAVEAELDAV